MNYIASLVFFLNFIYLLYSFINVYFHFKNTDFKAFSKYKNNSIRSIFIHVITPSLIIFLLGILDLIFYKEISWGLFIIAITLPISFTNGNVLLINESYISNLLNTISIKKLDYIVIENLSYKQPKLIFHMKNNKCITLSTHSKDIHFIEESLREYGIEVHVSNTYNFSSKGA